MSWNIFKQNIKRRIDNPDSIDNIDTVAKIYADEYDRAIKRGRDTINSVPLQRGNKQGMEQLFKLALLTGRSSTSPSFPLITEFGKGIVVYWTGAVLKPIPIPVIPAAGSIQNISVTSNNVTSPGTWSPSAPLPPSNSTDNFLSMFVLSAQSHLLTVSGVVNTVSLYPSAPTPVPAPGVIVWTGYTV